MATYNINKIKLPNGDIVNLVDETSGYAKSSEVPTVVDTYSSTGTDAVSGKAVNAALQTLDSSITATTGQAISAITITDGKITGSNKINVGDANQNAFSNVKVGSSTIAADTTTDTIELVAGTDITLTPDTTNDKVTIAFNNNSGYTTNTGTVTSVGLQNATNGGLSVSGSPVTGSGTISVGHSNILTNAQTTQALYPIAIDKNGHISSYGTAVDPEDIFLFEITGTQSGNDINYTTTATPAQISAALSEGKVPVAKVTNFGISGYHYFSMAFEESNSFHYLFVASYDGGDSFTECIATSASASSFNEIYVSTAEYSYATHVHGNITTDGKISSTAVTPANGDYILISDSSGSNKIERGIAIGTGTTKYLREDGTWQTITSGVSDVKINNTSILSSGVANIVTNTAYNSSTNKIATMSDLPSVTSTYSSTGTTAVNGTAVNAALQTLDSSITATTGQAISGITITDGKITGSTKINVGDANLVTDVQINGTSILSSKVANLITNTAYNSSTNKIATMSDLPSVPTAGTTASAVGTTSSGGSATTWSKSDHVHSISSSTITSALGFTPANSSHSHTSIQYSSMAINSNVTASSSGISLQYNGDQRGSSSVTINGSGLTFSSASGGKVTGIPTPTSNTDAANKKYVDDAVAAAPDTKVTNTLATTTKYYVTGTTSSTTNTGTQSFDSGIYATTTSGQLNATTYLVNEKTRLEFNSTTNSLDFIFI